VLKVIACTVSILALPAIVCGQTALGSFADNSRPASVPQPTGTATLRGRVFAADTGRPLRGARVQVTGPELARARATMTDLSGAYEFTKLPAGRFTLTASMPSFISLSLGQTRPFEAGKPIPLSDGQRADGMDLRLPRGGAIAGVVFDEAGKPLIAANVRVWRPQFVRGTRRLISVGDGRTNDAGEFRVFGLQPGSYLVSASKSFLAGLDTPIATETGYAPTFFPGTRSESSAAAVHVRLGQTSNGVVFAIDPTRVGSIAGATFFSDGRAALIGAAMPSVRPFGRPDGFVPTIAISGDGVHGTFRAAGLAPGEYEVSALATPAGSPPQGAFIRKMLNGENLTDLHLDLQPLPAATGRLIIDPSFTGTVPISSIKIATEPIDPWSQLPPTTLSASPTTDLGFIVYAPPGTCAHQTDAAEGMGPDGDPCSGA
jgi:hypothetical protein